MRNCFTYLIGWTSLNLFYYGKRTAKKCDPSDLFNSYFTSSKYVHVLIKKIGKPDIIKIRKTFGDDVKKCNDWEEKVLRRMRCAQRLDFLNKKNTSGRCDTTGAAPAFDCVGNFIGLVELSDERWKKTIFGFNHNNQKIKKKSKRAALKRVRAGIHHFQGDTNPSRRKVKSGTHHWQNNSPIRSKVDDVQRKLVESGEHYWQSKKHRRAVSKRNIERLAAGEHPFVNRVVCKCGASGQLAAMTRWHFKNCRRN